MDKGYITLNPRVRNKAFIYDYPKLCKASQLMDRTFWSLYWEMIKREKPEWPDKNTRIRMWDRFIEGVDLDEIADMFGESISTTMNAIVKHVNKRMSTSGKQSINYRIQGTGALMFKLASIKFFNWLHKNGLLFVVKYCIPVHDEINIEFPEGMKELVTDALIRCMKSAGDEFCKTVRLDATMEVSDHWVH